MKKPVLATDRLILRMGEPADARAILAYYLDNREHLEPYSPRMIAGFYTPEFWEKSTQLSIREFFAGGSVRFFLFSRDTKQVVGSANFTQIFRGPFHACYLGYGLAEREQGKGLMTEALRVAIAYVFSELNLHRIMANYMPRNERSGHVLKRLGFTIEGYAKNYLQVNGRWEDHVLTSLTNDRWQSFAEV